MGLARSPSGLSGTAPPTVPTGSARASNGSTGSRGSSSRNRIGALTLVGSVCSEVAGASPIGSSCVLMAFWRADCEPPPPVQPLPFFPGPCQIAWRAPLRLLASASAGALLDCLTEPLSPGEAIRRGTLALIGSVWTEVAGAAAIGTTWVSAAVWLAVWPDPPSFCLPPPPDCSISCGTR